MKNKVKRKSCLDCLYCKQKKEGAYCSQKEGKKKRDIDYWKKRLVCIKFNDVSEG